ncbi:MAG: hypothetical protein ABIC91_08655 [Nanoarchaeota archaeon]|nr:hypothetical protein [Nanoarchaeota archaeon]MBU1030294.1 hypothetical protein [Nanoarchaeota archaeon]MBU1849307.1 hypothetical protein [Nanoarchaeota archaeon]
MIEKLDMIVEQCKQIEKDGLLATHVKEVKEYMKTGELEKAYDLVIKQHLGSEPVCKPVCKSLAKEMIKTAWTKEFAMKGATIMHFAYGIDRTVKSLYKQSKKLVRRGATGTAQIMTEVAKNYVF